MRDYIQQFYTQDSMPVFQFVSAAFYFFNTAEECDSYINSWGGSSPGGGTLTPTAPVWFRVDKKILNAWLNSMGVQNLGPNVIAGDNKQVAFMESPRKFGVNSFKEKRVSTTTEQGTAKKSDFGGAATLVENFLALMQSLIATYTKKGDKRTVGILQDILKRFLGGEVSITEALVEMEKLFIIA
jgi:hypothetical protein